MTFSFSPHLSDSLSLSFPVSPIPFVPLTPSLFLSFQRVYSRHTLHNIVNIIHYINTHGQSVLVVKIQTDISATFDLYIYECQNEVRTYTHTHSSLNINIYFMHISLVESSH